MKPLIFISSVSRELRTARQLVANTLLALGYEPVWQDNFETSSEDIRPMLRRQVDSCSAVLQIIGYAYGAEPPTPDEKFGRVSYTQYEALYARLRNKPVYYLIAENDLPRDATAVTIDTPRDDTAAAREDAAIRQRLQAEYRQQILTSEQIYYPVNSHPEAELSVRRLRDDLSKLRRGFRNWMIGLTTALVMIGGGIAWLLRGQNDQVNKIDDVAAAQRKAEEQTAASAQKADEAAKQSAADLADIKAKQAEDQKITAARIRAQLIESSESALKREMETADKEPAYDEREIQREQARTAHTVRLSRIDDLATSFAEIEQRSDTTDEFREMTRILSTEKVNAVEKALSYAEKHRSDRFERVRARKLAEQQLSRADLQIDLKAASTAAASGQSALARQLFEQILAPDVEPNWSEALKPCCWFLVDQTIQSQAHGKLKNAFVDAERCLELAERLMHLESTRPESEHLLAAACSQLGRVLTTRGQQGDSTQALSHYTRSLEVSEQLLAQNPDSAEAARDTAASLTILGIFLATRGQSGDAEQACAQHTRSLELSERLLSMSPDSAEAARDVSISLNTLGDFLTTRGQPGDAEQVWTHYTRSLEVSERLLKRNPDSAQAARDVSISLDKLGDVLATRGQPGDAEQALAHYTRSLEVSEQLLAQNPDSVQAARDVSLILDRLGDYLVTRGQPGDAEQVLAHYTRSLELRERLLSQNPDSAQAARDVSLSLDRLGDFLATRGQTGDVEQALAHYTRGLEVRERLLLQNPDSGQSTRDISLSLDRLGNFLATRGQPGDADQALAHFTRGLEVRERLLSQNPDSAQAARDVSLSLDRLGNFLVTRVQPGDIEQALAHYTRGLEVSERLLTQNPNSAQAARDVSISLENLGVFLATHGQPGDAAQALVHYKRRLEVSERLLTQNPNSAQAARDISVSLNKLGDFLASRGQPGDVEQALAHYTRCLEVSERLLMQNPNSAQTARDVSVSLDRLGDFLKSHGRPDDAKQALAYYTRGLEVRERLLRQNPDSAQTVRDVMVSHYKLGGLSYSRDQFEEAVLHYQRGNAVLDKMLEQGLDVEATRKAKSILERQVQICQRAIQATQEWNSFIALDAEQLPSLLSLRVTLLAKQGKTADVAQAGDKLRELAATASLGSRNEGKEGMLYNAACSYSLCAGLVVQDKPAPTTAELAEQKRFIDLALTCLKESIDAGYNDYEYMREDADLTPLHEVPEFKLLLPKKAETLPAPAP